MNEKDQQCIGPGFRIAAGFLAFFLVLVGPLMLWLGDGGLGERVILALNAWTYAYMFGIAARTGRSSHSQSSDWSGSGDSDGSAGGGDGGAGGGYGD